jgi:RimJ/RimL family protein N-acetyltransferase
MCEECGDAQKLLEWPLHAREVAPWMSAFTDRPANADDAPWIVALHAAPHALPFLQQPSEGAVRASLARENFTERIVVDGVGARSAIWRASVEEGWVAELRTLAVAIPGRGAGTWALRRALAWAFEEQKLHRMFLYVTAANTRARALYERHGLQLEGTEREGFRAEDGGFEDLCHYGILEREYAARRW